MCAGDRQYSMRKQCQLLGVNRSSLYSEPCQEDGKNLLYMRLLDEQYTEDPSYGVMWSNVFSHLDKGRLLFLIYFYEGVFNEKTKDI